MEDERAKFEYLVSSNRKHPKMRRTTTTQLTFSEIVILVVKDNGGLSQVD